MNIDLTGIDIPAARTLWQQSKSSAALLHVVAVCEIIAGFWVVTGHLAFDDDAETLAQFAAQRDLSGAMMRLDANAVWLRQDVHERFLHVYCRQNPAWRDEALLATSVIRRVYAE